MLNLVLIFFTTKLTTTAPTRCHDLRHMGIRHHDAPLVYTFGRIQHIKILKYVLKTL